MKPGKVNIVPLHELDTKLGATNGGAIANKSTSSLLLDEHGLILHVKRDVDTGALT
jgi:hypothetical protein